MTSEKGRKTGNADEFLKPKRLTKIEGYYEDSSRIVKFDDLFGGEWMVDIQGCFADFEIKEIYRALMAANRLKPL